MSGSSSMRILGVAVAALTISGRRCMPANHPPSADTSGNCFRLPLATMPHWLSGNTGNRAHL